MKTTTKLLTLLTLILLISSCAPPNGGPPPGQRPEQPAAPQQQQQPAQNLPATQPPAAETNNNNPPPTTDTTNTETTTDNVMPSANANLSCAAATNFIDIQAHPQNSEYPAPQFSVTCTNGQVIVQSNGIPNFEFVPTTPNQLREQNFTFTFPETPTAVANPTDIPLGGAVAVTVNGLPIFGPTEAPQDGYRDPYLDQILDYCNGHTAPGGVYHFHARPDCLYQNAEGQVGLVIGYSFDGYPILAPYICSDANCTTITKVESGWAMTNPEVNNAWEQHSYIPGQSQLDQCNGMTLADGSYAYFATDRFPYFMGCYHGQATQNRVGR